MLSNCNRASALAAAKQCFPHIQWYIWTLPVRLAKMAMQGPVQALAAYGPANVITAAQRRHKPVQNQEYIVESLQPAPIGVVSVDDHPLILSGLSALIEAHPGFVLLGQGGTGEQALALYEQLRPDVMLIDLNMPGCGGVQAIRRIRAMDPKARLVVLTTYEGDEDVYQGLLAGASAYLLKTAGFDQIVACIEAVAQSRAFLPPQLARRLANRVQADALSPRELEILGHLSAGNSNKVIARNAGIGVGTVKYHVNNILAKLNVSCRTEAAAVAIQRGLVHPGHSY